MKKSKFVILSVAALFSTGTFSAADDFVPVMVPAKVIQERGGGSTRLLQYENGYWQFLVDGKPYIVKGMEYAPDEVGTRPKESNEWVNCDVNRNTIPDAPYESWVDDNRNDFQDIEEETVGDFQLLKDMGCNTIRFYHPSNLSKGLLRDLYKKYGIRSIMGNFMGAYTVGSGAEWCVGTDYTDEKQRQNMMDSIREMVEEYKDEPYVLMWMLGNENDTIGSDANSTLNNTNACVEPKAFAKFVGEVCRMIKQIDPNHPVGICNASYKLLPYYKKYAPEIDIIGMNSYAGPFGFGTLWTRVQNYFDRPVLITEYGCDAYNLKTKSVDEDYQANYHRNAWRDIMANCYRGNKSGMAIGGVVYCWVDKWWLCGSPKVHDTVNGGWEGQTIDGVFNDEWMGMFSQGDGSRSPFLRQPRKVYQVYKKELWNTEPR